MPRFTLKAILFSTVLITSGLAIGVPLWRYAFVRGLIGPIPFGDAGLLLWFAYGAAIGAGLLHPLKTPWIGALIGAIVGMIVQFASLVCALVMHPYG